MKVVIVGAGFAGIRSALDLAEDKRFEVTLISERSAFEYHAALYRSATGRSTLEVLVPLHDLFETADNIDVVPDRAKTVDAENKKVLCESGHVVSYDVLLLATGSVTEYFHIEGLEEFSYGIKSIQEALELKEHLHSQLKAGEVDQHYVVVGGGPSGVELAGELVAYLNRIYKNHHIQPAFRVDLVEAAPRVLPSLTEDVSQKVRLRLESLGVKVYTDTAVKGETANTLMLPEGKIETHTVIWTAGVANNPFFKRNEQLFKLGKGGRAEVDEHLQAAPDIYVLGDSAATAKSGWAQTAIYDAHFVTTNLKRKLSGRPPLKYQPAQPVGAIPVGPRWCAVSTGRWRFYGRVGWWVRRWIDLKLYTGLLPFGQALKTWLYGTQAMETCPICSGRQKA